MYFDGPSIRPSQPGLPPPQNDNPTNAERYKLAKYTLTEAGRPEDFNSILRHLSPPPDITTIANPGQFKGLKVGIIGGGSAGLATAFELRKLGYDITIFEALEERIGGRVYTYYFDEDKKYYGELGAMRIPVTHETTWHYINLFNLSTRPYVQTNENAFLYIKDTRVRNDAEGKNVMKYVYPKFNLKRWERQIPWNELLDYALETPLNEMPPKIREELLEVKRKYDPLILYWDYFNIRQVMEKSGLSQDAIYMLAGLSPFTGAFLYYNFIEVLQESNPVAFTFLYEIIGGMVNLPLALYTSLINPNPKEYSGISKEALGTVTWKSGHWVNGLHQREPGGKITLSYNKIGDVTNLYETFDYVICAIPFSTLRTIDINPLFSNRKMQAIRELGYATAQKTLFYCNHRFWEEGGPDKRILGGGSFTDLPISSIWYPSDHGECDTTDQNKIDWTPYQSRQNHLVFRESCSPREPGVITASYNFALDATRLGNMYHNLKFEKIKRQVEMVHGLPKGYLDTIVEDFVSLNWNQAPYSLGAFSYYRPEQKRVFSYPMTLPELGLRVFFAGEHLSSTHGWLNGAFQTGMIAANDIANASIIRRNTANR